MRRLPAIFVACFIVAVGAIGVLTPDRFLVLAGHFVTESGLYAVAVLRVAIGIVLIRVARISRTPKVILVLGVVMVVSGIVTPFFGVDRSRAVFDWLSMQELSTIRALAGAIVVLGAWLAYAVSGGRRLVR